MPGRVAGAVALVVWLAPLSADERLTASVESGIRREADERSEIMRTLHVLTDIHGPRVTGSPSLTAAAEWAVRRLESWGLTNGRLEPWDFGHPGWTNERVTAHIVSPVKDQLVVEVLAWTPGTNGPVTAPAYLLELPQRPTADELLAFFDRVKDDVRGRIVLAGRSAVVPVNLTPPPKRRTDEQVRAMFDPDADRPARTRDASQSPPGALTASDVSNRVDQFLLANGALLRINDARREHGQIIAFDNRTFDVARVLPTVVMRNEDYGRIARIVASGTPVQLELDIVNRVHPEGRIAYNALADIGGTDLKDEIVMLGGHLDSWHSATGATDNAIGCAVMMEAARIIAALGVRPRRTIRVALWSGEEQGLLGSRAYVAQHFGSHESPKPAFDRLVAYLNIDNGTGRARGAEIFGPPQAAAVVRQALARFADLGLAGAVAVRSRSQASSDSASFSNAGLPAINFRQDPIEYDTHTHHTNLDTYERVIEDDVKTSAKAIAAVVYELAMRDEQLPRFRADEMPKRP